MLDILQVQDALTEICLEEVLVSRLLILDAVVQAALHVMSRDDLIADEVHALELQALQVILPGECHQELEIPWRCGAEGLKSIPKKPHILNPYTPGNRNTKRHS